MSWIPSPVLEANAESPYEDQEWPDGDRPEGVGLIHSDDFSDYQPGVLQGEFTWVGSPRVNVAPDPDDALNDTVAFTMLGTPDGTAGAELGFTLNNSHPEIWVKYRLYIPLNYVHRDRVGETDNNKGNLFLYGSTKTDSDIAMRFEWLRQDDDTSLLQTYSKVYQRTTSNDLVDIYPGGVDSDGRTRAQMVAIDVDDKGTWFDFICQIKVSDRGATNGRIRAWKNTGSGAVVLCDWRDLDNSSDAALPTNAYNGGYLIGAANSGYLVDTYFNIDDYSIGTSAASIGFTVPA